MAVVGLVDKYSRSYIASAISKGFDLDTVCDAASVDKTIYNSKDRCYGPEDLSRISRYVKRLMDDEFCGLTRRRCKSGTLAMAIELILSSKTLEEALDKAFRFYALVTNDVHFDLIIETDFVDICVHIMEPELDAGNHLTEWLIILWRDLSGWLVGEQIPVVKTRFAHQRAGAYEEYSQVFLSECVFMQAENSITFHRKYLRKEIVRDMQDFKTFFATSAISLVGFSGIGASLKSKVRSLLKDHLFDAMSFYSMESIAGKFNLSVQSLRRQLEQEGTSFRAIKEDVRREAAMAWLSYESVPVQEVSYLCGFAEPNGLARAMKAWAGMSPTAYREKMVGGFVLNPKPRN